MATITSLKELRTLKCVPPIEIKRAGSFYKARWPGRANFVFGASLEEAQNRLLNAKSDYLLDSRRNGNLRNKNLAHGFREVES